MKKCIVALVLPFILLTVPSHAVEAPGPELKGEAMKVSIEAGGLHRTFLAYIPSAKPTSPALIMVLHGSLGTGEKMRSAAGGQFDRLAEQEGCVVVYPDGIKGHWNDCRSVPGDAAHRDNVDDVGFITALIEDCVTRWGIDRKRVFALGLSNGGHLCFRLGTEIPDRLAGIAAMGASMPLPAVSRCPPPRTGIPVVIINGTNDPINPFEGGMVKVAWFFRKGEVLSSLESARLWLEEGRRNEEPARVVLEDTDPDDGMHVEKITWPGSSVALYAVHGGGHTVPGGSQYLPGFLVGRVFRGMDTAREAWRFFQEK